MVNLKKIESNEALSTIVYNINNVSSTSKESSLLTSLLDHMKVICVEFYINTSMTGNLYVIHNTHDFPVTYFFKRSPPSCLSTNPNNVPNNFD